MNISVMARLAKRMYRRSMRDLRNVCLIDPTPVLAEAFERIGCTVLTLQGSPASFFSLPEALEAHGFTPDLVMQREVLAERCLLTGLEHIDCPTIFWAVDPHLNAHWHSCYARLFDVTCSTQRAWVGKLAERGAPDVRWLPMYGRNRAWTDMAHRKHALAFVGRVTDQRSSRKWMLEFLRERCAGHNMAVEQNLGFEAMMQLYMDSRIIPNESIFGEINFRLFEAASCGCVVLGEALGEEQEMLFEPGREMDTYSDVVEFGEKLKLYLDNPRLAQAMGMAAYKRVQAEHLPEHRAAHILQIAQECVRNRASGTDHEKWLTLTLCAMSESGMSDERVDRMLARLAVLPQDADVLDATLRIQVMSGLDAVVVGNMKTILASGAFTDSTRLNLTGTMAALKLNQWDMAQSFWLRYLQWNNMKVKVLPNSPIELLTMWAKELKRTGVLVRTGFAFDATRHLAASAVECLLTIWMDNHEHLPTLRLLDSMVRTIPGTDQARVGFLSILTLHERQDWRLALEIALVNLKSFRHDSGIEELHLALDIARSKGQESIFRKALAARDTSGLLVRSLG